MVREWSYINTLKINYYYFFNLVNKYQFKVFRKNVRFKKFTLNKTYFVRRNYIKRKELRNYLVNYHITKYWVIFFLKKKQVNKFIQNLFFFKQLVYLPNFEFLLGNFDINCCTYLNVNTCSWGLKNFILFKNFFNNNKYSLLQYNNTDTISMKMRSSINLYFIDNIFYKTSYTTTKFFFQTTKFLIKMLTFNIVTLYKILIKLTLYFTIKFIKSKKHPCLLDLTY